MPLADTGRAIGEVTELLRLELSSRTGTNVTVGRVEPPSSGGSSGERLNLFLFENIFDGTLKNLSIFDGQPPQLWLALRYLLTAFDTGGQSDTVEAHRLLGTGLRALQQMGFLSLDATTASSRAALDNNPESLKITFIEASSDLLSRIMQGSDEQYRFSMAFELRPVMIATGEPGQLSLLVGVDYTQPPPDDIIGEEGIGIDVFASLSMRISAVEPAKATAGDTITITGENLIVDDVVARIGPIELPVTAAPDGGVSVSLDPTVVNGDNVSAGQHPLSLVRTLSAGRTRCSNLLIFELLPTVTNVTTPIAMTVTNAGAPDPPGPLLEGTFNIDGTFLGDTDDNLFVALYADGQAIQVFSQTEDVSGSDAQTQKIVTIPDSQAVPPGDYRVIASVNNSQARQSPSLTISVP